MSQSSFEQPFLASPIQISAVHHRSLCGSKTCDPTLMQNIAPQESTGTEDITSVSIYV
jgi:hypothetical protein